MEAGGQMAESKGKAGRKAALQSTGRKSGEDQFGSGLTVCCCEAGSDYLSCSISWGAVQG